MPTELMIRKNRWIDAWFLIAFTAAAFMTRFYGITEFPLFDDEVTSYFRGIHHDIYTQFPGTDLLIILFFKVFGTNTFFLRLPMALFGAVSIPIFFALTRRLFDRFTAVCGTLLLLFSYYHLDHSQLTRYYAAIFFFGVLASYFYLKFFETYDKKTLLWALLATLGGTLFHPTFLGVPLSISVFSALVLLIPKLKNESESVCRAAKLLLMVFGLSLLVVLISIYPIIKGWFYRSQSMEGGWGYGFFRLGLQISKYFGIPLCLATLAGIVAMFQRNTLRSVYCGTLIVMPVCGMLCASMFVDMRPDYIFYTYPIFFIASARLIAYIRDKAGGRIPYLAVMALLLATMLPEFASNYTGKRSLDVRHAVSYVKDNYKEGDKILSFLEGFNFYMGPEFDTEPYLGTWYHSGWEKKLKIYEDEPERLWIVYMESRGGVAPSLKKWLHTHARLVYEVPEKRFDYTFKSVRIYLKEGSKKKQPPTTPRGKRNPRKKSRKKK